MRSPETRESATRPGDVFCDGGAWFIVIDVEPLECDGPMSESEAREHAAEFGDG